MVGSISHFKCAMVTTRSRHPRQRSSELKRRTGTTTERRRAADRAACPRPAPTARQVAADNRATKPSTALPPRSRPTRPARRREPGRRESLLRTRAPPHPRRDGVSKKWRLRMRNALSCGVAHWRTRSRTSASVPSPNCLGHSGDQLEAATLPADLLAWSWIDQPFPQPSSRRLLSKAP